MNLLIRDEVLKKAEITAEELLIEIAVHLYNTERLSLGEARSLVQLDIVSFQKELSKRNVFMKYDVEDLDTDLKNLEYIRKNK